VKLGDTITWNVQGVMVPTVCSRARAAGENGKSFFAQLLRRVRFQVARGGAPKQFAILVASAGRDGDFAHLQRDVVRGFPSVSSLDLSLVQRTVTNVLGKGHDGDFASLALISLALGVPVLFSAVAAHATRATARGRACVEKRSVRRGRQIGTHHARGKYALLGHARRRGLGSCCRRSRAGA